MTRDREPRERLIERLMAYGATEGLADRSLREIAAGLGTSHRMLLYHFGSREGVLAAVVEAMEARQRAMLAALTDDGAQDDHRTGADGVEELMLRQWEQLSDPQLRPFIRLFFAVVGLAVQGTPGTEALLPNLTTPWLDEAAAAARRLGMPHDPAAMRLGVAASRGLLLELLAGADPAEVTAAYRLLVRVLRR